jgi:hypothetical protein
MDDFLVEDHGSILILQPLTAEANEWIEEYLDNPETWAGGVVVEPRYIDTLVEGILSGGLTIG